MRIKEFLPPFIFKWSSIVFKLSFVSQVVITDESSDQIYSLIALSLQQMDSTLILISRLCLYISDEYKGSKLNYPCQIKNFD